MQGIKRKRRCQNQCQEHLFSLKNLKNNSKYDIKLTFCPKYQRQPMPPQHTYAEYNNDGLFYTSAFVLGVDKKIVAKNLQKEMLDHQKLIKQNCEKYNQIVFPRPNSKHTTCSVCKQTYKNYYLHIFSEEHSEKIQTSPYNVFVKELCQLFKNLWEGCSQKADQQAVNQAQRDKLDAEKKGSEQLDLAGILQQEDINSNPSRISQYLNHEEDEESEIKQIVMKRPPRIYEPAQIVQKPKVYEDRQSRKRHINFAAFFQDQPKKKIINDNRDAISVTSKKTYKTTTKSEIKAKQKTQQKKEEPTLQFNDPFIIEYNARSKRKQKKSYYYIKKKEREEREQRQREQMLKNQNQNIPQNDSKSESSHQNYSAQEQFQNQFKNYDQSGQGEIQKIIDNFHAESIKSKNKNPEVKKPFSSDLKLFEQIDKKPFPNPIFESFSSPNTNQLFLSPPISQEKTYSSQKPVSDIERIISQEKSIISPEVYPVKKSQQNIKSQQKKYSQQNVQQLIIDKNKIPYYQQNQLPLLHRFKHPLENQAQKENNIKMQKGTLEVFNEYEQKLRQYHKQKDYNLGVKLTDKVDDRKIMDQNSEIQQNAAKFKRVAHPTADDETFRYVSERNTFEQSNNLAQLKNQSPNKYNLFSDQYPKKPIGEKQLQQPLPMTTTPILPGPYTNPHPFYPPYGYPIPQYNYPLPEQQKIERANLKYPEQKSHESFERGYLYGAWQPPYYLPPQTASQVEGQSKSQTGNQYTPQKEDSKPLLYPGYPGYPTYPPGNYPYYHAPGAVYPPPPTQRPDYPAHQGSNLRLPHPPNTSININFPMYLGPPYHSPYQYQPNPRYSTQGMPNNPSQAQYFPQNSLKTQSAQQNYGPYGSTGGLSSLPPYAEYQEYKKRQNQRRR